MYISNRDIYRGYIRRGGRGRAVYVEEGTELGLMSAPSLGSGGAEPTGRAAGSLEPRTGKYMASLPIPG